MNVLFFYIHNVTANRCPFRVADLGKTLLAQLPHVTQLEDDIPLSDPLFDIAPDVFNGVEIRMVWWQTENCVSVSAQ
jgi:hypothetical protein